MTETPSEPVTRVVNPARTPPVIRAPLSPVILAIESSADMASAAVLPADGAVVQQTHKARHGHAAQITELARVALAEAEPNCVGAHFCYSFSFTLIRSGLSIIRR